MKDPSRRSWISYMNLEWIFLESNLLTLPLPDSRLFNIQCMNNVYKNYPVHGRKIGERLHPLISKLSERPGKVTGMLLNSYTDGQYLMVMITKTIFATAAVLQWYHLMVITKMIFVLFWRQWYQMALFLLFWRHLVEEKENQEKNVVFSL